MDTNDDLPSPEMFAKMADVSAAYHKLVVVLDKALLPNSRPRRMALERLEEAFLWATAGVTSQELSGAQVNPPAPRSPERKETD